MDDPLRARRAEIIAALRAERQRQGLSQRVVGARMLACESSVGQWENRYRGKRKKATPDARSVRAWHGVLGLPVPADVDVVFRPDVPRCPSRQAFERHRRHGERCAECWAWMQSRRPHKPRTAPMVVVGMVRLPADVLADVDVLVARWAPARGRVGMIRRLVARGLAGLVDGEEP